MDFAKIGDWFFMMFIFPSELEHHAAPFFRWHKLGEEIAQWKELDRRAKASGMTDSAAPETLKVLYEERDSLKKLVKRLRRRRKLFLPRLEKDPELRRAYDALFGELGVNREQYESLTWCILLPPWSVEDQRRIVEFEERAMR